jgi:hypothetical protein
MRAEIVSNQAYTTDKQSLLRFVPGKGESASIMAGDAVLGPSVVLK